MDPTLYDQAIDSIYLNNKYALRTRAADLAGVPNLHRTQTPKKNTAASAGKDLASGQVTINGYVPSALEVNFSFALIDNFKSKPDFDWDKIAATTSLTRKEYLKFKSAALTSITVDLLSYEGSRLG
ncbi:hypothetical protein MFIFM68171_08546 [Madurella fahalii]|uniref:Uncharacterized protein n=1 Tax=Madurella fahalii TaxID=1157608 RepID=A0ABQ0GKU6_9PEZI